MTDQMHSVAASVESFWLYVDLLKKAVGCLPTGMHYADWHNMCAQWISTRQYKNNNNNINMKKIKTNYKEKSGSEL